MPKAVLKNGVICPLEPLPPEWEDGRELRVEADDDDEDHDIDAWYRELQALVAQNDANDWARVEQSIRIADDQAKAPKADGATMRRIFLMDTNHLSAAIISPPAEGAGSQSEAGSTGPHHS